MVTGTVSDAAKLLRVSQPAASGVLHHLQDQLRVALFEKVRGRLVPTPEALSLFQEIEGIWSGIDRVRHSARNLRHGHIEILRVLSVPSLIVDVMPKVVIGLLHQRKQLSVNVEAPAPSQAVRALLENRGDIAFVTHRVDHPGLSTERMGQLRIVCVMPRGHRLASKSVVSCDDLEDEPLVTHSTDFYEQLFPGARAAVQPGSRVQVQSAQSACRFVNVGAGLALVDELAAADGLFPSIEVRPLEPAVKLDLDAIWVADRPLSGAALELKSRIQGHFSQAEQVNVD